MKPEKESEYLRARIVLAAIDLVIAFDAGNELQQSNAYSRLFTATREYQRLIENQGSKK